MRILTTAKKNFIVEEFLQSIFYIRKSLECCFYKIKDNLI